MKNSLKTLAPGVAVAFVLLALQTPVAASDAQDDLTALPVAFIEDVGATERVNLSGKLRMLSQRIPSAACHLAAGVDPEGARTLLASAKAEFEKILNALEFGDPELNINGAEARRKTLAQIQELRSTWQPFAKAVDQLLDNNVSDETVTLVLTDSMDVLDAAKLLVSEVSGQYSNPAEMTQAGAMMIDIAGRQRMLTQKMSKESCAAWSGLSSSAATDLAGTMQVFEASLTALTHGMPGAGIKPPPTAEIAAGLAVVGSDWADLKDALATVSAGEPLAEDRAEHVFQHLNTTMADMNKVVVMYSEAVKLGL